MPSGGASGGPASSHSTSTPVAGRGQGTASTSSSAGGGGSNGSPDELVAAVVVIIIAVAVLAAVGLTVTEGLRYDGFAELHPGQPVHLTDAAGIKRQVPLGALTEQDVIGVREALVKDDEGFGLLLTDRAPLDRRGFAFKLDFGGIQSLIDRYTVAGAAANIQLGFFPWQRFGLLAGLALTGGDDGIGHAFVRHSASLEAQAFPLRWRRLHVGGYANGGQTLVMQAGGTQRVGPSIGAGALLEIDLTTRMALTGRIGVSSVLLPGEDVGAGSRWSPGGVVAVGLAIY